MVYSICPLFLFKSTNESHIQKHWAFLWTREAKCTGGGQCKVAWEDCYLPKCIGGSGIPDIAKKSTSLLKKFLFKFQWAPSAPWIDDWLCMQYDWNDVRDFGDEMVNAIPPSRRTFLSNYHPFRMK